MSLRLWTDEDTARATAVWAAYQRDHDLAGQRGQTAGIDPASGRIWFGESIPEVVRRMNADGLDVPLYFVRVGYDHYYRKGASR